MKKLRSKIGNLITNYRLDARPCASTIAHCSLIIAFCLLFTINSFADVKNQRSSVVSPTIQAAVDAAVNGDKLLVSTGLYLESVSITNKFIELEGGYLSPMFSSRITDNSSTVIGTNIIGAVVNIGSGGGASLDTFTITGGNLWGLINGSGVLIKDDCICTMKNCHVYGNYAYFGGGISAWSNSTLFVDDCIISHNESWFGGGGIAGYIDSNITLTNNSECILNFSSVGGGIAANSKNLTINGGATVVNNTAISKGGGIYLENCGLCNIFGENTSIGEEFAGNQVTNGCGGGIYAVNSSLIISGKNCRVNGAVASDSGGGIYLTNSYLQLLDEAEIGRATSFSSNSAQTNGGGVWMGYSKFIASGGAKVLTGVAGELGGGIYAEYSDLIFKDNSVIGCEDNDYGNHAIGGGGILLNHSAASFENASVLGNYAEMSGGGIVIVGTNDYSFINTTIANNESEVFAGGIHALSAPGNFLFENSQIISNSAFQYGAILFSHANIIFTNCQINYNFVSNAFGTIVAIGGSLLLQNTEISHNKSIGTFAGITVLHCPTTCEDCTFDSNVSQSNTKFNNGGALFALYSDVSIKSVNKNSEFIGNCSSRGGAITLQNGSLDIIAPAAAKRCMFIGNAATINGGAIFLDNNTTSTIAGNVFFASNRAGNGGAIASMTNCWLSISSTNDVKVMMINNFAETNGGALYISGLTSFVNLVEVKFDGNQAFGWNSGGTFGGGGGGAAIMNKANLKALNCVFNGNICSNSLIDGGSAVLADNSVIDIYGDKPQNDFLPASQILNNNGEDAYGGAVSIIHDSKAYISGTIIASNSASNGGGIFIHNSNCKLVNSIVAKNSANLGDGIFMGGALYSAELILQNSDIVDNDGYGLYFNYGTTTVQNCVFWGNSNQIYNVGSDYFTSMFSNVEGGYIGVSNINENPLFTDVANLIYQLTEASPCRDIGMIIPAITNDCIGEVRPQFNGYDIGAYEFVPEPCLFIIYYLTFIIYYRRNSKLVQMYFLNY